MADHSLKALCALCALGAATPRIETVGSVRISENPGIALASVAARPGAEDDMAAAAAALLGEALPSVAKRAGAGPFRAIWVGPGQWMVEAPFETHEDLAKIIKAKLGSTASVTEQTDAWVRFDIGGVDTTAVFERLCSLDISTMPTNSVARTTIHHLGCFIVRPETKTSLSLLGPRSAAASLHHALTTAARSVAAHR